MKQKDDGMRLVFLGTGTSEGVPRVSCLVARSCEVCLDAMTVPESKNRRFNTSLLLQFCGKNVLVDCGKFFWQSALRFFPMLGVSSLDALVLTHDHNDACYGLDDLRDFACADKDGKSNVTIPVWARPVDIPTLHGAFPYLFGFVANQAGGGVSQVDLQAIPSEDASSFAPVKDLDLHFIPLPVIHGRLGCNGYLFRNVAYISDVKVIPDSTLAIINAHAPEIIIIDCLRLTRAHGSHFILEESLATVRRLKTRPKKVWLVGMNHETSHQETNHLLRDIATDVDIELAYDGLILDL